MSDASAKDPVRVVVIGHGGWRIQYDHYHSLHGCHDDWQEHVAKHAADTGAVIIDLTTAPFGALYVLSVSGPLLDVDLPAGMVRPVMTRQPVPFAPDRRRGFLGNAGSLDDVALDVYCAMAAYIGATIQVAYRADVTRPPAPLAWLPRRRRRPEGWEPPSVRRRLREPPLAEPSEEEPSVLAELLPDGWETDSDFVDALLICPCGYTIEQDGRCPEGCVSPLIEQGLI